VTTGSSFISHRISFILLAFLAGTATAQHVLTTITTGRGPTAVIYDSIDRKVFVSNRGSGTVSVIDPNSNIVTATIPVGEGANAMCWSKTSNKIFVACAPVNGNGWVYVIDAAASRVVGSVAVGQNPNGVAWCESRNKVYCLNASPNGPISVLGGADFDSPLASRLSRPETDVPVIPIPGQTPNAIAYNPTGDRIYVSSATTSGGTVWAIDPYDDNIEASVTSGASAWELEVNPVANRVYCSNRGSNTVSVISCSTNQKLANLTTPGEPHPVCWIPTDKIFVGEYWNRTVAFMHGESLRVSGRFPISGNPGTMVYLPATQKLFVANYLSNKVSACDARDGYEGVLVDLDVGSGPLGMAVDPNLKYVYVANSWDSTVTVIAEDLPAGLSDSYLLPPTSYLLTSARAVPNPCPAGHTIKFEATGFAPSRLDVRDAAGRLVLQSPIANRQSSIALDPASMPAGVYFCSLSDGRYTATCRVTVR
jgi:YVTN family beta-propeller protein